MATDPNPDLLAINRGRGWYAQNTGPRDGQVLRRIDGDLVLTAADSGKTFEDLDVAGTIDVSAASGVTLRDVRAWKIFTGYGGRPGADVSVSNCEVHGELLSATPDNLDLVTDGSYFACNIHSGFRGVRLYDKVKLVSSWVHDLRPYPDGTHRESLLSNGMAPDGYAYIVSSWLEAGSWSALSGEVALYGDYAPIHDVTIYASVLMDSGSFQLYAGSLDHKPHPDAHDIVVVQNTFGPAPADDPPGAQYGHVTGFDSQAPGHVWMNNFELDGTEIPTP